MSFAFIVLAFCLVPLTGVATGLVELVQGDTRRRSIVRAFPMNRVD